MWRSWGGDWPQSKLDWYDYALLGVSGLRREILLRHWDGEEGADIARRFQISENEVTWHIVMMSGHFEAIFEARKRQLEDERMLAFINRKYPALASRIR